jgi:hypothetical protein
MTYETLIEYVLDQLENFILIEFLNVGENGKTDLLDRYRRLHSDIYCDFRKMSNTSVGCRR